MEAAICKTDMGILNFLLALLGLKRIMSIIAKLTKLGFHPIVILKH
jgi:hypothetical protein